MSQINFQQLSTKWVNLKQLFLFSSLAMICSDVANEEDAKKAVKEFYDQLVEEKIIENLWNP